MLVVHPEYKKFIVRVLKEYYIIFSVIIIVSFFMIIKPLLMRDTRQVYVMIGILAFVFLITLVRSFFRSRFYLYEVIIDSEAHKLKLKIYKYDLLWKIHELDIDRTLDVTIARVNAGRGTTYKIVFKQNNKTIMTQRENLMSWDTDMFLKIVEAIDKLQGKNRTYNYVKNRW